MIIKTFESKNNLREGVIIHIGILGTGKCLPKLIRTNEDLSKMVDTSDEWIMSRTGIKERRIAIEETTSGLAIGAATKALESAKLKAEDIELIIVSTITPEMFTPSTACIVQDKIGAKNAVCFDLSAACSGFIYALTTGHQFLKTGMYKNVLVIGAEALSKITDWEDRNTCVLFGDGAGAVVLGYKEEANILSSYLGSDGSKGKYLTSYSMLFNGSKGVKMDGRLVYNFATNIVDECIDYVINEANINIEDIDHFILHQANIRIINSIKQKYKLEDSKLHINIDKYGNTSSASIPILLDEVVREGKIKDGDRVVLLGFGGGLTWACFLMEW